MAVPLRTTPASFGPTRASRAEAGTAWPAVMTRVTRALRWIAPIRAGLLLAATGSVLLVAERLAWPVLAFHWAWWASGALCVRAGIAWWRRQREPDGTRDRHRAALWIEEQGLTPPDFSLVTAIGMAPETITPALHAAAESRLRGLRLDAALWRVRRAAWLGPTLLLGGTLLVHAMPRPVTDAPSAPDGRTDPPASRPVPPLGAWRVVRRPPAYVARPSIDLGDAPLVRALEGSSITLTGEGPAPAVEGRAAVAIDRLAGSWRGRLVTTAQPTAIRLTRGGRTRQLLIEPLPDSTPRVQLQLPTRDTVFRTPDGSLRLAATVQDDWGLADAAFDLLITSGEGERFTVRPVRVAAVRWPLSGAVRTHRMQTTIRLGALGLQAGDVVHLRAVARDHQPDTLRRLGSSETRAFRIARTAEYDSVAVEAAAPLPVDSSRLSQRMLLRLTERLDARQARMARTDVLGESSRLARDQGKLRQQIGDLVFQRLSGESPAEHAHSVDDGHAHGVELQGGRLTALLDEGNDAPVIAVNQPLLAAYNAMWDAGRALEIGDPHGAIPAMRRALLAIEQARAASRVYLRGTPPRVILDLARIRLVGRDTGRSATRPSRAAGPSYRAAYDARLVRALRLATARSRSGAVPDPQAARDSLALLRLEAVADAPAFAQAIEKLLAAMSRGGDVTAEALAARRTLGVVDRVPVSTWSRMPGGTSR